LKKKILITGASGLLGHNACHYFLSQGYDVTGVSYQHDIGISLVREVKVDLMDPQALADLFENIKPDYVLHCAAITNVDACEDNPDQAHLYNVSLPERIAQLCSTYRSKLIYITTDQLWDGTKPFMSEADAVEPLNIYAETKAISEQKVLDADSTALIIRTNFFGQGRVWRLSFSDWIHKSLSENQTLKGFDDIYYTPIAIDILLERIDDLIQENATGLFHVAGSERVSKYAFMVAYATAAGLNAGLIEKASASKGNLKAKRPADMSLSVNKVEEFLKQTMPNVQESISRVLNNHKEKKEAS
jgi:dTDP-4-dehydrorhamnose reductase